MRTFDFSIVSAMMANATDEIFLWLLEFSHPDLNTPLNLVVNTEDVVSNGVLYSKIGCTVELPDSKESGVTSGSLSFSNINQVLVPIFRSLPDKINVHLKLVTASDLSASPPEFDNVRIDLLPFRLTNITWNEKVIRGSISYDHTLGRPYPCVKMDIFNTPALF